MDITVKELKEKLDRGDDFVLVDVRETYENAEFNVGGTLIPLGELPGKIGNLAGHESDEIVVYCRSGNRSGSAKKLLQQAGFTNVRNLEGGMLAWVDMFGTKK